MVGVALMAMALSAGQCTKGTEFEPPLCPTHFPAIVGLSIERTAGMRYHEEGGPRTCRDFRPSAAQVRRFLSTAGTTDAESADATLDRSPCYASGRVTFSNGRSARWTIEQYGVGTLDWPSGKQVLLYCDRCRQPPFKR